MKYLFIFEDGILTQSDDILPEIFDAWGDDSDGIDSIVDMEDGLEYCGDDQWGVIEIMKEGD